MMGREDPQLKLRLSEEMKASVTEAAKSNGRSVNSEIVARLEAYDRGGDGVDELKKALHEEHQAFLRMDDMFTKQTEMVDHYRILLSRANREVFQQAVSIELLAEIIIGLEGPPSGDIVESVKRILKSAQQIKAEFGKLPDVGKTN